MKKLLLKPVLFLGIAISIVACSKDDETKTPEPAPSIIATWTQLLTVSRTEVNNTVTRSDSFEYEGGVYESQLRADGKWINYLATMPMDTLLYVSYADTALMRIEVNFPERNDTTLFNKVTMTKDSLILGSYKTQVTGGNTIKSIVIEKYKRK